MPKNYRTPSSFFTMLNHENMDGFTLQAVSDDSIAQMGQIIDEIRHINSEDPNFIYTCMCDEDVTQWLFAYADKSVHRQAKTTAKNMFNKLLGVTPTGATAPLPHVACACPLGK